MINNESCIPFKVNIKDFTVQTIARASLSISKKRCSVSESVLKANAIGLSEPSRTLRENTAPKSIRDASAEKIKIRSLGS